MRCVVGWLALSVLISRVCSLRIVQIVPGFTNSHVLFNYRLAETLRSMGHEVWLWVQLEMSMLDTSNNALPVGVQQHILPIQFSDRLKVEGLKVFQQMMFSSGTPYDLWWTGREFSSMRVEACQQMINQPAAVFNRFAEVQFDLAIAHFHDLCPLAIANRIGVHRVIWMTHGPSMYDFTAVSLGLRTVPSSFPHPLSSAGHTLSFLDRLSNFAWSLSSIDFVNLPQSLLHDENDMYIAESSGEPDLWWQSGRVPLLLLNGERLLDFPRPLSHSIAFTSRVGSDAATSSSSSQLISKLLSRPSKGIILFSLGTVSNTTHMPAQMIDSFASAFIGLREYTIVWRMEREVPQINGFSHIHLLKWIPQRDLMRHTATRLLIAHGGYNSLLETAQAGVPALLMPLFADQHINAQRAARFGFSRTLDKLRLTPQGVAAEIHTILNDERYTERARSLSRMLGDQPPRRPGYSELEVALRMSQKPAHFFSLERARIMTFFSFYSLDLCGLFIIPMITVLSS